MANINSNNENRSTEGSRETQKRSSKFTMRVAVFMLFPAICVLSGYLVFQIWATFPFEMYDLTKTLSPLIDQYMRAMNDQDVQRAMSTFDDPLTSLNNMLQDNMQGVNRSLFANYQKNEITGRNIKIENQDGKGEISGIIYYDNGFKGFFSASVVMRNGIWKLVEIEVYVPPSKVETYIKENLQNEVCD